MVGLTPVTLMPALCLSQSMGSSLSLSSTHTAVRRASASWSQQSSMVSLRALTAGLLAFQMSGKRGRALCLATSTCICSVLGCTPTSASYGILYSGTFMPW
uniref:Putative secreted protein n=1 Tax=Ixodes ricinus TaxID=34613 RepID=A0A6B0UEW3_IXORI